MRYLSESLFEQHLFSAGCHRAPDCVIAIYSAKPVNVMDESSGKYVLIGIAVALLLYVGIMFWWRHYRDSGRRPSEAQSERVSAK